MTAEELTSQPGPAARPRRSDATRAAILRAARERFAVDGYERATIRAIAAEAGIDPSMVMRYYGSKENLFARAAQFDLRLPDLSAVPRRRLGETLIRTFLDRWEHSDALPIMLRAAMTNAAAARQLQTIYRDQLTASVAAIVPVAEAQERAGMVASQILGLAICRYVLKFPPLAEMPGDQVVARFGPTLQRYLTGPLQPASTPPATAARRKKQARRPPAGSGRQLGTPST
jgi:AcrR family transcriptional regulator